MRVIYKPWETEVVEQYRCMRSGRKEFDGIEACHKARWLVRQKHGEWAMVFDGETLFGHWEWNTYTSEARKVLGPDL